jgi:hypothetical protein
LTTGTVTAPLNKKKLSGQFIETAKEISHLEQDMYRLSAIITEQRKFLVGLQDTSLLGDTVPLTISLEPEEELKSGEDDSSKTTNRQEEGRRKLVELMENVEGLTLFCLKDNFADP